MQKFVFLDIDDVLIPWNFHDLHHLKSESGWDDFEITPHLYIKAISMDMLNYIAEKLGDHIYWLTTWEADPKGANELFCDTLKIRHFNTIPNIKEIAKTNYGGKYDVQDSWWKSKVLQSFISTVEGDWRGVWIDDEMDYRLSVNSIDESLVNEERLLKMTPEPRPCLTKPMIDSAISWLNQ